MTRAALYSNKVFVLDRRTDQKSTPTGTVNVCSTNVNLSSISYSAQVTLHTSNSISKMPDY